MRRAAAQVAGAIRAALIEAVGTQPRLLILKTVSTVEALLHRFGPGQGGLGAQERRLGPRAGGRGAQLGVVVQLGGADGLRLLGGWKLVHGPLLVDPLLMGVAAGLGLVERLLLGILGRLRAVEARLAIQDRRVCLPVAAGAVGRHDLVVAATDDPGLVQAEALLERAVDQLVAILHRHGVGRVVEDRAQAPLAGVQGDVAAPSLGEND
jgi:hypothetical protein